LFSFSTVQTEKNSWKNLRNKLAKTSDEFVTCFFSFRHSLDVIDFLEYVIKSRPSECSELVYNNLLEHYLHHFKHMDQELIDANEKKLIEDKIMNILASPNFSYDNDHALGPNLIVSYILSIIFFHLETDKAEQFLNDKN
jgi:hypothetical protein